MLGSKQFVYGLYCLWSSNNGHNSYPWWSSHIETLLVDMNPKYGTKHIFGNRKYHPEQRSTTARAPVFSGLLLDPITQIHISRLPINPPNIAINPMVISLDHHSSPIRKIGAVGFRDSWIHHDSWRSSKKAAMIRGYIDHQSEIFCSWVYYWSDWVFFFYNSS